MPQPLENTNTAKAKDWIAKTNTKKGVERNQLMDEISTRKSFYFIQLE